MKKFLAITLTSLIALAGSGATVTATAVTEEKPALQASETVASAEVAQVAAEQHNLYLVPGVYMVGGEKRKTVSLRALRSFRRSSAAKFSPRTHTFVRLTSVTLFPNLKASGKTRKATITRSTAGGRLSTQR